MIGNLGDPWDIFNEGLQGFSLIGIDDHTPTSPRHGVSRQHQSARPLRSFPF
jgi:hypothetical protein